MLQGASYQDELCYRDELEAVCREHSGLLDYVPTVSRPREARNASWRGATGRVNEIVERCLESSGLAPASTQVYACGHPGMIEDVKRRVGPRGFRVKEERFWSESRERRIEHA